MARMLIIGSNILKIAPERGLGRKFERETQELRSARGDFEKRFSQPALKHRNVRFIRGPTRREVLGTACA
jgi:hypothetical protein